MKRYVVVQIIEDFVTLRDEHGVILKSRTLVWICFKSKNKLRATFQIIKLQELYYVSNNL